MTRNKLWSSFCFFVLVALSMQGCFGIGDNSNSSIKQAKTIIATPGGHSVGVNQTQNLFSGKIYFTIDRNIWVYSGNGDTKQLTGGMDARDPSVSPDGKSIAFIARYKYNSDLVYMSTGGGHVSRLLSGAGQYFTNSGGFIQSSHHWFAQPAWSLDGGHVLFLSDLQKDYFWANQGLGANFDQAPFVDMQVFMVPLHNPPPMSVIRSSGLVAFAFYGDGGNRDPGFRPGHPTEIIFTHYAYDSSQTHQVIQLFLEDITQVTNHPERHYRPALLPQDPKDDPGIAITPPLLDLGSLQPTFSPDGHWITYIRRESATSMGLSIMPVPEGVTSDPNNPAVEQKALQPYQKSVHILSGQFISQPVWAPDGKQIAYLSFNNGTFDVWLVNVTLDPKTGTYKIEDKTTPVQLTTGGVDADSRPFWTA